MRWTLGDADRGPKLIGRHALPRRGTAATPYSRDAVQTAMISDQQDGSPRAKVRRTDALQYDARIPESPSAKMLRTDLTANSYMLETTLPRHLCSVDMDLMWALHPELPAQVVIHGRLLDTPRFSQSFGRDYAFSGVSHSALPVPPEIAPFLEWCNDLGLGRFDQILVNWYADGRHYIGAHSDDERQLRPGSPIVTVSLGATRTFRIRHGKIILRNVPVSHGKVLAMCGLFQRELKHEVPKTAKVHARRISLAFRQFL